MHDFGSFIWNHRYSPFCEKTETMQWNMNYNRGIQHFQENGQSNMNCMLPASESIITLLKKTLFFLVSAFITHSFKETSEDGAYSLSLTIFNINALRKIRHLS